MITGFISRRFRFFLFLSLAFITAAIGAQGDPTAPASPDSKDKAAALAGVTKDIANKLGKLNRDKPNDLMPPTYANLRYGPHERNVLDFWRAESDKPTPLIVYIHGGGFVGGDKSDFVDDGGKRLRRCLENGVSAATINYPFVMTNDLLTIIHDAARAVQFIRAHAAEWNIDKGRVAVYGESAGAGTSLWLAFHDDLADPNNPDPVLRESTRVTAAGALATQATYDFSLWPSFLVLPPWLWDTSKGIVCPMYYHMEQEQLNSEAGTKMRKDLDMLSFIDSSDAPVFLRTNRDMDPPKTWDHMLHHAGHAVKVRDVCKEKNVECILIEKNTPKEERVDLFDFLFAKLGVKEQKAS